MNLMNGLLASIDLAEHFELLYIVGIIPKVSLLQMEITLPFLAA